MTTKKNYGRDIDFLFEMGNIRFIERQWKRFLRDDFANLAEHHFRMFWIAMIIAAHEKNVDTGKIAKMVLIHDIAESRVGDVDYLARQYVVRNEKLAIEDMLSETSIEKEFYELWKEYEDRTSIEAKIVKDADNLDVDFELNEQAARGSRLKELWEDNRSNVAKNHMFTETGKAIAEQLATTDPHRWHNEGRNRNNSGDWKH